MGLVIIPGLFIFADRLSIFWLPVCRFYIELEQGKSVATNHKPQIFMASGKVQYDMYGGNAT